MTSEASRTGFGSPLGCAGAPFYRHNPESDDQQHRRRNGPNFGISRRVHGLHPHQHNDEQEHHHDGAGVNHNLDRAQELGTDRKVDAGHAHHHGDHIDRGVNSSIRQRDTQSRNQRQSGTHRYEDCLTGAHLG